MSDRPNPANAGERAQPESFRGRALGASLTVKDLQASVHWYHEVAGFTVDREYERDGQVRSVAVKAGDVSLLLNQDDGSKGRDRVKGQGFSMRITTVQDIDTCAALIRQRGGVLETEPTDTPWGDRIFRVKDPDGFLFTISSVRG